jgi:hypothetical protein
VAQLDQVPLQQVIFGTHLGTEHDFVLIFEIVGLKFATINNESVGTGLAFEITIDNSVIGATVLTMSSY